MPQDPETMAAVGLKSLPKWWIDRQTSSIRRNDWRVSEMPIQSPSDDAASPFMLPLLRSTESNPRSGYQSTQPLAISSPTSPSASQFTSKANLWREFAVLETPESINLTSIPKALVESLPLPTKHTLGDKLRRPDSNHSKLATSEHARKGASKKEKTARSTMASRTQRSSSPAAPIAVPSSSRALMPAEAIVAEPRRPSDSSTNTRSHQFGQLLNPRQRSPTRRFKTLERWTPTGSVILKQWPVREPCYGDGETDRYSQESLSKNDVDSLVDLSDKDA